jgi:hypothetical protein
MENENMERIMNETKKHNFHPYKLVVATVYISYQKITTHQYLLQSRIVWQHEVLSLNLEIGPGAENGKLDMFARHGINDNGCNIQSTSDAHIRIIHCDKTDRAK